MDQTLNLILDLINHNSRCKLHLPHPELELLHIKRCPYLPVHKILFQCNSLWQFNPAACSDSTWIDTLALLARLDHKSLFQCNSLWQFNPAACSGSTLIDTLALLARLDSRRDIFDDFLAVLALECAASCFRSILMDCCIWHLTPWAMQERLQLLRRQQQH